MPSLSDKLSRLQTRLSHRMGGFRGYVEGVRGNDLMGWVQPTSAGQQILRVGVFVEGARVAEAPANIHRPDLEAAGIGTGHHGFAIPLTPELMHLATANGGSVELRVLDGTKSAHLGRVHLDSAPTEGTPAPRPLRGTALQKRLYTDLTLLGDLVARAPLPARPPARTGTALAKAFGSGDYLSDGASVAQPAKLPAPMFAYMDYVRTRYRVDTQFDTANVPEDVDHFFKFYLGSYAPMRRGLRVPMSAEAIAWLNAPLVIGGQPRHLSRATWMFLTEVHPILHSMNFSNPDWYAWAVYWWSVNHVQAMGCEDCLVPESYVKTLAHVREADAGQPYPVSEFMRRIHSETGELSELPLDTEDGRRDLTCALLLMALTRPDTLRYLPTETIDAALTPVAPAPAPGLNPLRRLRGQAPAQSPLERFCEALEAPLPGLDRAAYTRALRHQGFELDGMRFHSHTAEGHRVEAARLPALSDTDGRVDIQVIGPIKKASGLGQATRLSVSMLQTGVARDLGLSVSAVDYSLDNPAPEGFNSERDVSDYQRARINIFHVNGESVPLSVAYQPDVMEGAYNIGYFYWELDTPAACHYLALDMLDEVWVSTDYGVAIYQPEMAKQGKTVTNVGMSYEALPEFDATEARRFLQDRAGVPEDAFVMMVVFDSFSFVQRKNPLGVLAAFERAFPLGKEGNDAVRLVIKTQNRARVTDPVQMKVWEQVDAVLARDPRVKLIDETLHYDDLLRLKKGADAYISLHRSEGWGFGMIEAMNLGTPVLATGYSGNMDFCTPETCWLVDYKLVDLKPDDYILVRKGQQWAEPDIAHAAKQMRAMRDTPKERAARAKAAKEHVQSAFSEAAIGKRYATRMREILKALEAGKTPAKQNGAAHTEAGQTATAAAPAKRSEKPAT